MSRKNQKRLARALLGVLAIMAFMTVGLISCMSSEDLLQDNPADRSGPTVLQIVPDIGVIEGGTPVTISGRNFKSGTDVIFGGFLARDIQVVDDQTITAVTPAQGTAGKVDVKLRDAMGQITAAAGGFTFSVAVTPNRGSIAGGTQVTVLARSGISFGSDMVVLFGDQAAANIQVLNNSVLTCLTPPHAAGAVDVTLRSTSGQDVLTAAYTYVISADSVLPSEGTVAGGVRVAITGSGFGPGTAVFFGNVPATDVTVVNDALLFCMTPPHAAGAVDVTVRGATGSQTQLPAAFVYVKPGSLATTPVMPAEGMVAGGTRVAIAGSNLVPGTTVLFGGVLASGIEVINDSVLACVTPAHVAGIVDVTLLAPGGSQTVLSSAFTYLMPSGSGVTPNEGSVAGGTRVALVGTGFGVGTAVLFDGIPATAIQVLNDSLLACVTPPHAAGVVDVAIRDGGGSEKVLADAFTYVLPASTAVTPTQGAVAGGTRVAVFGSGFGPGTAVFFGDRAATGIQIVNDSVLICLTPSHPAGVVDVTLTDTSGETTVLEDAFTYVTSVPVPGGPRLVSAVSTGNTSVRVTFNEAVGAGANDPANYSIVQANVNSESAGLIVLSATPSADGMTIELLTASQNEVTYELHVTDIRDLDGNPLAPADLLVDPTRTQFAGTPPVDGGDDSDCDGLSDAEEQMGWRVTVQMVNGDSVLRTVTSNPGISATDNDGDGCTDGGTDDTDGDGLTDAEEKAIGCDPRARDTDGDTLGDYDEWNVWYSDPNDQDSDDDSLSDSLEVYFRTSPILADTDGDQLADDVEMFQRNRNPLVADLPVPQIFVDEVRLDVKITSSYTDEDGVTHALKDSRSSQFQQSRSDKTSRSDTRSTQAENEFSQKLGAEVSYSTKDGFGGKVTAEAGFGQKRTRGFSSAVGTETASESQQQYQQSVEKALEFSEKRAVTRTIDQAIVQANVNLANNGDIAFSITNLEVSVLQQDRRNSRSFRPIATLRPGGATDALAQPTYNLGPFDPERGPIIFQNVEIFPNLVDDLMREPTGLVFEVVNYDILDEFGRNFAFSSQEVNDRTVGITIDYGDGIVETYRVATASTFDTNGKPLGISMLRALQIAGLAKAPGEDAPYTPPTDPYAPLPDSIRKTYGTISDANGYERLTRVRGVQNDLASPNDPQKRFWATITNNMDLPRDVDFSEIPVRAGQHYLLLYTRDVDEDHLYEREEHLYGSSDNSTDTDGDGLLDYFEVRTGWTVSRIPGQPYKTFSDPAREDSDGDGLLDNEEKAYGTDPNRADTDEDGLLDVREIRENLEVRLFDGDADDLNDQILTLSPYTSAAIIDGGNAVRNTNAAGDDVLEPAGGSGSRWVILAGPNGVIDTTPAGDDKKVFLQAIAAGPDHVANTTASGDDVQIRLVGATVTSDVAIVVHAGPNEKIVTRPSGDDFVLARHERLFTTDPLNRDTDFDGVPDGREIVVGSNPNAQDAGLVTDSDGDGLYDLEEDEGWVVTVYDAAGTPTSTYVTSNKYAVDTDLDGIADVWEWAIGSNPRARDTDGDSLSDLDEFDPADTDRYYNAGQLARATYTCSAALNCQPPVAPPLSERLRTHVCKADSDGDGRTDVDELNVPWVVDVYGATPYQVYSLPYRADADSDGLNDGDELGYGTDPNNANTDGDNRNDGSETNICVGDTCRNPLRKDIKVTFTYTTVTVVRDCDPDSDGGQFRGQLRLHLPDGAVEELYDLNTGVPPVTGANEGTSVAVNVSRDFLLYETQNFAVDSTEIRDVDPNIQKDERMGVIPYTGYSFEVLEPGNHSYELKKDDGCWLIFYWNIAAE
jgi:hypothetical protein